MSNVPQITLQENAPVRQVLCGPRSSCKWLSLTSVLVLAMAAGLVLTLTRAAEPTLSTKILTAGFFENFDGMKLLDQNGRALRLAGLSDKIVVVNFVFTGCATTCPTQTLELVALQQALPKSLKRDVRFLSVSVDPLGDTPALLRAYGESMGVDFASWTFATGRVQDIERLSERLRLFRDAASANRPQEHATSLLLIDGTGRLMQRYGGASTDIERLKVELAQLRDLATASRPSS